MEISGLTCQQSAAFIKDMSQQYAAIEKSAQERQKAQDKEFQAENAWDQTFF